MALRVFGLFQPMILHARFLYRLDETENGPSWSPLTVGDESTLCLQCWLYGVDTSQFIRLPRFTGEVAQRAGGGERQSRRLPIPDLKFPKIVCGAFPLRPV
jgi:hypothetical protein